MPDRSAKLGEVASGRPSHNLKSSHLIGSETTSDDLKLVIAEL